MKWFSEGVICVDILSTVTSGVKKIILDAVPVEQHRRPVD